MAKEVETRILEPLRTSCKTSYYQSSHCETTTKTFEIKVIYVRIKSSAFLDCNVELMFPPREPNSRLCVNGREISYADWFSVALNKNRVDAVMSESLYVSTNSIRFCGGFLWFEIRAGVLCPVVVGLVKRKRDGCLWAMECRGIQDNGVDGGAVDVYFAGKSNERPLLLQRVVGLGQRWKFLDCIDRCLQSDGDDTRGMKANSAVKEHGEGGRNPCRNIVNAAEEEKMLEEEENEVELSLFNEGVRLGMGLGLGVCLGVVGLFLISYQAAAVVFKRFI